MSPWWWRSLLTPASHGPSDKLIYDCFDDIPNLESHRRIRGLLASQEADLLSHVDLSVVTSAALHDKLTQLATRMGRIIPTLTLPNGVDFERFQQRLTSSGMHARPEVSLRPSIGFVGAIGEWIDFELIQTLAHARPDYDFVLVGPLLDSFATSAMKHLSGLPNVKALGRRPYSQVPSLIGSFDVCVVPFRTDGRMATVNSNKFYQYLAAGRPVVATLLPEAVRLAPFVLTSDRSGFAATIDLALLMAQDKTGAGERQRFAQSHAWNARADVLVRTLREL